MKHYRNVNIPYDLYVKLSCSTKQNRNTWVNMYIYIYHNESLQYFIASSHFACFVDIILHYFTMVNLQSKHNGGICCRLLNRSTTEQQCESFTVWPFWHEYRMLFGRSGLGVLIHLCPIKVWLTSINSNIINTCIHLYQHYTPHVKSLFSELQLFSLSLTHTKCVLLFHTLTLLSVGCHYVREFSEVCVCVYVDVV